MSSPRGFAITTRLFVYLEGAQVQAVCASRGPLKLFLENGGGPAELTPGTATEGFLVQAALDGLAA